MKIKKEWKHNCISWRCYSNLWILIFTATLVGMYCPYNMQSIVACLLFVFCSPFFSSRCITFMYFYTKKILSLFLGCVKKCCLLYLSQTGQKLLNTDWLRQRACFLNREGTFGNQEGMVTWSWLVDGCLSRASEVTRESSSRFFLNWFLSTCKIQFN